MKTFTLYDSLSPMFRSPFLRGDGFGTDPLALLDRDTTRLYLEHRFRLAGVDRPLFAQPALEALFAASSGLMRHIDDIAHHALAAAALARARLVEPDHVLRAAEETRA